jgi:hypothetical protein
LGCNGLRRVANRLEWSASGVAALTVSELESARSAWLLAIFLSPSSPSAPREHLRRGIGDLDLNAVAVELDFVNPLFAGGHAIDRRRRRGESEEGGLGGLEAEAMALWFHGTLSPDSQCPRKRPQGGWHLRPLETFRRALGKMSTGQWAWLSEIRSPIAEDQELPRSFVPS